MEFSFSFTSFSAMIRTFSLLITFTMSEGGAAGAKSRRKRKKREGGEESPHEKKEKKGLESGEKLGSRLALVMSSGASPFPSFDEARRRRSALNPRRP